MNGITFSQLVSALEKRGKVTRTGDRVTARCPAHDDHSPSLDVDKGKNGKPILICRSQGCSFESIIDALNLKGVGYDKPEPYHIKKHVKLHSPAYLDENNLIVPLVDIDGKALGNIKILPEKIKTSNGKMEDKFNSKGLDTKQSMFVFGNLESSSNILVATGYSTSASLYESTGQAVVMTLSDTTLPATIGLLRERYAEKEIVICADHDARLAFVDTAKKHHAKLCYPDGVGEKADFNDLAVRHGKDAVCEVVSSARYVDDETLDEKQVQVKPLHGITGAELLLKKFAPIAFLMLDLLPTIGVFLLAGKQKLGKSWFALALALAHVCGGKFLNRDIPKGKVLYLGLEDSERRMQSRILVLQPDAENNPCIFDNIRFFHATDNIPRLDQGLIQFMEPYLSDVTLVVVDVLQKVRPIKSSGNIYQDDYAVITALQTLALSHNLCVLLLTHTRKQDADDAFDTIMSSGGLSGAADGSLVLTRKRGNGSAILHVTGREVPECEYGLTFKDGVWTFLGSAEIVKATNEQNEIVDLLIDAGSEGMTVADIADSLGKNEPVIRKLLRKLVIVGRVRKRDTKPAPHFAVCDGPDAPPLPRAVTTHTHIDR